MQKFATLRHLNPQTPRKSEISSAPYCTAACADRQARPHTRARRKAKVEPAALPLFAPRGPCAVSPFKAAVYERGQPPKKLIVAASLRAAHALPASRLEPSGMHSSSGAAPRVALGGPASAAARREGKPARAAQKSEFSGARCRCAAGRTRAPIKGHLFRAGGPGNVIPAGPPGGGRRWERGGPLQPVK